jgi:hypothetical protein
MARQEVSNAAMCEMLIDRQVVVAWYPENNFGTLGGEVPHNCLAAAHIRHVIRPQSNGP